MMQGAKIAVPLHVKISGRRQVEPLMIGFFKWFTGTWPQ